MGRRERSNKNIKYEDKEVNIIDIMSGMGIDPNQNIFLEKLFEINHFLDYNTRKSALEKSYNMNGACFKMKSEINKDALLKYLESIWMFLSQGMIYSENRVSYYYIRFVFQLIHIIDYFWYFQVL